MYQKYRWYRLHIVYDAIILYLSNDVNCMHIWHDFYYFPVLFYNLRSLYAILSQTHKILPPHSKRNQKNIRYCKGSSHWSHSGSFIRSPRYTPIQPLGLLLNALLRHMWAPYRRHVPWAMGLEMDHNSLGVLRNSHNPSMRSTGSIHEI